MKGTSTDVMEPDRNRPAVGLRIGKDVLSEASGGIFSHVDPSTGKHDCEIPLAGPVEIDRAVDVAHRAYLRWRDTRPAERRRLLLRLADLMDANRDEFIRLAVLDGGTPVKTARDLFTLPPEWTRYYAGAT